MASFSFGLFSPILKSRRQLPASYFTSSTYGTRCIVRDKTFVLCYRGPNPGFVVWEHWERLNLSFSIWGNNGIVFRIRCILDCKTLQNIAWEHQIASFVGHTSGSPSAPRSGKIVRPSCFWLKSRQFRTTRYILKIGLRKMWFSQWLLRWFLFKNNT